MPSSLRLPSDSEIARVPEMAHSAVVGSVEKQPAPGTIAAPEPASVTARCTPNFVS